MLIKTSIKFLFRLLTGSDNLILLSAEINLPLDFLLSLPIIPEACSMKFDPYLFGNFYITNYLFKR